MSGVESNEFSFQGAINIATEFLMEQSEDVVVLGLGASYEDGLDGSMGNLSDRFSNRIFDTPVSEAAVTGLGVGAAATGLRPIIHHGRVEFALFAIDQIATQAAKWNSMFGGGYPLPITFRVAVGRQWGNGPQHTQLLPGLFGGITGLNVVVPSSPLSAARLLIEASTRNQPTLILESRWLNKTFERINKSQLLEPLGLQPRVVRVGGDVTMVTHGDGVLESLRAARELQKDGIEVEIIDLVSINPLRVGPIIVSLGKTKNLVTLDVGAGEFTPGQVVVAKVSESADVQLSRRPLTIAAPHEPVPTQPDLIGTYYPNSSSILSKMRSFLDLPPPGRHLSFEELNLWPNYRFEIDAT